MAFHQLGLCKMILGWKERGEGGEGGVGHGNLVQLLVTLFSFSSKECQAKHWQYHKPACQELLKKDCAEFALTEISRIDVTRQESIVNVLRDCSSKSLPLKVPLSTNGNPTTYEFNKKGAFQELNACFSGKAECEKDGEDPCVCSEVSNQMRQIPGERKIAEDDLGKETVTVFIKHDKMKHKLCVPTAENGKIILQMISDAVSIPVSKLKLIHKGKMATCDNIQEMLFNKALFLAFGEVCESEDGLEKADIDLIVKQLDAERSLAIKVLRETGNVLDAIIKLGNR